MIKKEDKPEFIGQIMDLFEDFLDEYGIKIPQKEEIGRASCRERV